MQGRLKKHLLKNFKNYWPKADGVKNIEVEEFQSLDPHFFKYRIKIHLFEDKKSVQEILRATPRTEFNVASFLLKIKNCLPSFVLSPLDFLKREKIFLYKEIQGKPLRRFILQKNVSKQVSGLVEEAGITLKSLHRFFKKINFVSSPSSPFIGDFKTLLKHYPDLGRMILGFKKEFQRKYQRFAEKKQIIHGDFTPSNIIVQENKKLKIIDFGSVRHGFPYEDVACFLAQIDDLYLWGYISPQRRRVLQRKFLLGYFKRMPSKNILKRIIFFKSAYLLSISHLEFYSEVLLQNMGSREKRVIGRFLKLIQESINI